MSFIPQANPHLENDKLQIAINSAISRVIKSGSYILGKEVSAFEAEISSYLSVAYGIGVSSGTDALFLALTACDVGRGHEVILPSHTAVATAVAVRMTGATPVFADIEENYFTLDPESIEINISERTKAVIAVHLYGQPADLAAITKICQKNNLYLIEDCAQALGSKYHGQRVGTSGHLACFSFYPTKNLGAIGDGGCIVTNDKTLAEKLRSIRQYGWDSNRLDSVIPGYNCRLDEIQAAILREKLRFLDEHNDHRNNLAQLYIEGLDSISIATPVVRPGCYHTFHLFVIRCYRRDSLIDFLFEHQVGSAVHYRIPVHQQTEFKKFKKGHNFPETEKVSREIISLPIYPYLKFHDLERIIDVVRRFLNE